EFNVLPLLILGYMIIIMGMTIHFKADKDNPLVLLYPLIVAFYGWMAVAVREKWMFLPLYVSMFYELIMAGARLVYIDSIIMAHRPHDPTDPTMKMMADFYPGFVQEVAEHMDRGAWFRMRELLLFFYMAATVFLTLLEIDMMNRERLEGAYRNHQHQMAQLARLENADVVGPAHPVLPPPSYEAVCADHAACPIVPGICDVATPSSELPPSYGEVMMRRKETSIHIMNVPRSNRSSSSCSTARFSAAAAASKTCSTCSYSLRQMPSCATPSGSETGWLYL
ncbi:hypothetical protein PENTCL1PPCAC_3283, partial [Pristionchus entomophagus]